MSDQQVPRTPSRQDSALASSVEPNSQPELGAAEASEVDWRALPIVRGEAITDERVAWPIRSHETLGRGAIQEFVRDEVETPTGDTMKRDYLRHTGAVGIIALDDEGCVLVVRQYRHPVGFKLLEPPAGLLDVDGEDWLIAAQRELAEEAMMQASDWRVLVDYLTSPGCLQESLRVFLARGLSPAPRPDGFVIEGEEADMDVVRVPLDELVDAIFAGRVQNPTMVVGALAAHAAVTGGRLDSLRHPEAPWPARDAKASRDSELDALG